MSKPQIGKGNFDTLIQAIRQYIFYTLNCARVGIIQSFDSEAQTATIQLVDKRILESWDFANPQIIDYPLLTQVPVIILKGKNGGLTTPITTGDTCYVIFNDRNLENWFADGQVQAPNPDRAHDLSDGVAIVGLRSSASPIDDYDNEATTLNYLDSALILKEKIALRNATQSLKTILDNFIDIVKNLEVLDPISGPIPITTATADQLDLLKLAVDDFLIP